ncbi:hypothetical protein QW71_35280 [Paenibacillus sp. IHB B 3415]|uniref:hypothetical protein n=1 Tax=Paenibacillus sp. IHB B 3415 TaxID=867080 RepID=UPI000573E644|nr:hypothetical protein [Paenibacillus sp. IHB B 3415]KHL91329.1 hypothetical protein QW71_35280 [Paenibacillus sp. IHB B 3415]
MRNKGKLAIATLVISTIFAATSAFAATSFSGSLPANQGDTEISADVKSGMNMPGFSVQITNLGSGKYVRAWTEKSGFWTNPNLSSPYNTIIYDSNNIGWANIPYDIEVPAAFSTVILNLDNPVNLSSTVSVSGEWTAN